VVQLVARALGLNLEAIMAVRVECPHCRHVSAIDARPQGDYSCARCRSRLSLCPQCCQPRSAGAVICINCGLDFRTGKKVVASPEPQQFGEFTICPLSPREWTLTVRRRFLGIPAGTQEFRVVGFDKVYYDTVDSWTTNVAPTAASDTTSFSFSALLSLLAQLFKFLALLFVGFLPYLLLVRLSGNSDAKLFFEVGLIGPRDKFLRLKESHDSAQAREFAEWLSETLGLPIERRDRRSPD
jgi:hypothetical protein